MLNKKEVEYLTTNSYSTLNALTKTTTTVWIVFHGLGYLSRYFLTYFKTLDPEANYIIAPQAPSKYYIDSKFKRVGSCWLTRENTTTETENVLRYIHAAILAETLPKHITLNILGYSQGVSIAMRYLAKYQYNCDHLILHSGGIPVELTNSDFTFFTGKTTLVYGDNDTYLNADRIKKEIQKATLIFNDALDIVPFNGKHEVNINFINTLDKH